MAGPNGERRPGQALRALAKTLAGPLLIGGAVLVVLRAFAFQGKLTIQHPDLVSTFFPSWCYMGQQLGAGHIPAWNPHVMGGIPFAADPLSGWMYLPVMTLFTGLPCQLAMRWFLVLQSTLAGLGVYWFLRSEGLVRPAATVAGLALGLGLAGSSFQFSLPFASTLTWTALLLAAASRLLRARTWSRRLVWLAATALAWGQLAAAHLSDGLVPGTIVFATYLVIRLGADVKGRTRTTVDAVAVLGLIVLALPLLNLAYLLPRLAYLPRSTLGQGYVQLDRLAAELRGARPGPVRVGGQIPTFPLRFSAPMGLYMGSLALGLVFAGWRAKSHLYLVVAFAVAGAVSYLLSIRYIARHIASALEPSRSGSYYGHFPGRFGYMVILALAVMAGLGVQGWLASHSWGERAAMLVPGVLVWGLVPVVLRLRRWPGWLPLLAAAVGLLALALVALRPRLAAVIPVLVAAELTASAMAADLPGWVAARPTHGSPHLLSPYFTVNREALVPGSSFVSEGPIARALAHGPPDRYMIISRKAWSAAGYHVRRGPAYWGLMGNQRSMLFGLEEAQGYNSIQLRRYWTFVRAVDPKRIAYNGAGFLRARPIALDLLQVGYLIHAVSEEPPLPTEVPVTQEGRWVLYRLRDPPPRASLIASWSVVPSANAALRAVLEPGFAARREVVLETSPAIPVPNPSTAVPTSQGTARYEQLGEQAARVTVTTPSRAILLVRNTYDQGWHATVDGQPTQVLPADYLVQGIAVPAGTHTVELTYDEPSVGAGMIGSGLALTILLGSSVALALRARRRRPGVPDQYNDAARNGRPMEDQKPG